MKIFVYRLRDYDEKGYFEHFTKVHNIECGYTSETPVLENLELARGYDAIDIITSPITPEMVDKLADMGVKCIVTRSIGYDHINVARATERGIGVLNVTYGPDSVADYTIMLMLMGLRKIKYLDLRSNVQDFSLKGKIASTLPKATVGIIGTGKIGERVIQELQGFGCKILAYDTYEKESVKTMATYVTFEELVQQCDIISLHAPALESTFHMLDKKAFDMMKDGVGIVNCARGPLIDTEALIDAIENKKVGFACLDTIEGEFDLYYFDRMGEPLKNRNRAILNSYPNVIVMPHMAFYTDEVVSNMVENSMLNVREFFETGKCINL